MQGRTGVAKRRPFAAEVASPPTPPLSPISLTTSAMMTSLNNSLMPTMRVMKSNRSAICSLVSLSLVAAYVVLKYWFVVSGVYFDTLEKVQGCTPRNLELVRKTLDSEYDGYMKDEVCDSHMYSKLSLEGKDSESGKKTWRERIDEEQKLVIAKIKKNLPKIFIYEPQIDLLVSHMNFLDNEEYQYEDDVGEGVLDVVDGESGGNVKKRDKGRPCEVFLFHDMLKRNMTGTLVSTIEEADRVENGLQFYRSTGIDRLYKELKNSKIGSLNRMHDVFIYAHRHYTQRTGFGLSMREILKKYEFTILSPEVTNLKFSEIQTGTNWLYKHIVVPQVPLLSWTLPDALSPSHREYKFCFMGTLINKERRGLVDVMLKRKDSLVITACRNERVNLNRRLRKRNASTVLYRHCEMCMIPLGDSLSDRRLFDAANAGCIPIITNDLRPLPFPINAKDADDENSKYIGGIDWHNAVLRAPITDNSEQSKKILSDRLDELAKLSPASMRHVRQNTLMAATRFSFSSCGGHWGLLLALQRLNEQRWAGVTVPMDLYTLMNAPVPTLTNYLE